MTKEEAIKEERSRYIRACIAHNIRKAHRHFLALVRLDPEHYKPQWKEVV